MKKSILSLFVLTTSILLTCFVFARPTLADLSDPVNDPDINIRLRGWGAASPIQGGNNLIDVGGDTDYLAPQLSTLLGNDLNISPTITSIYQVNEWDFQNNRRGGPIPADGANNWGVTMIGIGASSGEEIRVPKSGYDIGGGYQATVLYATQSDITISYTNGSDSIVIGYVLHLFDINVNPKLLAQYNQSRRAGQLVALPCGAVLGTARGSEVLTIIRDTGSFMDPRTEKDWWHAPSNPSCEALNPLAITPPPPGNGALCQNPTSEFHSLRPYPFCTKTNALSQTVYQCANTITVQDNIYVAKKDGRCITPSPNPNGITICSYQFDRNIQISADFSSSKLPILGNTENVANSVNKDSESSEKLNHAAKVNDYVSWYLNGVINRAEYPFLDMTNPIDVSKIVDFSGPINKLLPRDVQFDKKINTVNKVASGKQLDQTVACTIGIKVKMCIPFTNICLVDKELGAFPTSCYDNQIASYLGVLNKHPISEWESHLPPKRADYDNYQDYYKADQEWRGKICAEFTVPDVIPIIGGQKILMCVNDPGNIISDDYWAELFPYIPYSPTIDSVGQGQFDTVEPIGDVEIKNLKVDKKPTPLYFPHIEEVSKLSKLLQKTYNPKEGTNNEPLGDVKPVGVSDSCKILESRSGPGDKIGTKTATTEIAYDVSFSCMFSLTSSGETVCTKNADIRVDMSTLVPKTDEIWQKLVGGASSVFRRIYPKTGVDSPIKEIRDIPASTEVKFNSDAQLKNNSGEIYIPHIGALQEYFLQGIQTALRPKDFGSGAISGSSGNGNRGTCSIGNGPYCSVENLAAYFGGNTDKATKASIICQRESGGNPTVKNIGCSTGESVDYSIGLFQINLLAHCPGALSYTENPVTCQVTSQRILDRCLNEMMDPVKNIQKMVELSSNGTNWGPWSAAAACNIQ